MAKQLSKLGVDIIEAGFPFASPGDFDAVKRITADRPHERSLLDAAQSGIALLRAAEGRAVTVVFANQPTPLQAQEIEWDLRAGTLEIRKPLVTGGR